MEKLQKTKIFATCETLEDLYSYFELHIPEERRLLLMGAGLMWNTIAHMQEKQNDERGPA